MLWIYILYSLYNLLAEQKGLYVHGDNKYAPEVWL